MLLWPGRWPVVWSRRCRRLRSSVALVRKEAGRLELRMALPQKLCGSCREGGWLSGAEDGAAPESLRLSRPSQKRLALCIPHGHPCSLPSAESRSQEGSRRRLCHKPLRPGRPRALTRKVAGYLLVKFLTQTITCCLSFPCGYLIIQNVFVPTLKVPIVNHQPGSIHQLI